VFDRFVSINKLFWQKTTQIRMVLKYVKSNIENIVVVWCAYAYYLPFNILSYINIIN